MKRSPQKSGKDFSSERDGGFTARSGKKKNSMNIPITASEIKLVFEFLDTEKKGFVTVQNLRDKLGIFYRNLTAKDYKQLMNHKAEQTEQDLYNQLADNELSGFDPMQEAFKIYAPNDRGCMERETLHEILTSLGFADLRDDDIIALMGALDQDGDGDVGYKDFMHIQKSNSVQYKKNMK